MSIVSAGADGGVGGRRGGVLSNIYWCLAKAEPVAVYCDVWHT